MVQRNLNRAYDRLERLQRLRKGELVPPSLNFELTHQRSARRIAFLQNGANK
jgi:hypothetical protein